MTEKRFKCPYCEKQGLKLLNYGNDKVWECMKCGAELWYCETVEEMKKRCKEIKKEKIRLKDFITHYNEDYDSPLPMIQRK